MTEAHGHCHCPRCDPPAAQGAGLGLIMTIVAVVVFSAALMLAVFA